jgi:membrane-associated protease RseP (regulator of RpoE activity)
MKLMLKALLASTLFTPSFWNEPVFAQEGAGLLRIEPSTAPTFEFTDVEIPRALGGGEGMREFIYATAPRKMEKGTFLGVTTSSVPAALREQMSLQRGFGLVVENIEEESPAAKAGIQKYDILQKLNDQQLINQPQLQVLVRSMKANESVAITLLRKGQPITVNATLVEKDVPELVEGTFEGVAPALAPKIMQWEGMGDPGKLMKRLRVDTNRNATIVSSDGEQTLELSQNDGKKNLVVKDKSGKVIFEGPIDTPEQKAKLPQGVEEKLTSMEGKLHKITVRIHADDKEEHEGEDK